MKNLFKSLFQTKTKAPKQKDVLCIREGVESHWNYHLAIGKKVLCGNKATMESGTPLNTWGFKSGHIPFSYCKECERIAKQKGMLNNGI